MAVTETETISWGSRISGSIKGILGGIILFVGGLSLIFYNEGRAVKTAKALDEGEGACVAVESSAKVDPQYDGQLVHMTGKAETKAVLEDALFGVTSTAIRLVREVEMYQWDEESHTTEKKNLGGSVTRTTTYTYRKGWFSHAIDSSGFKEPGHDNPGTMEFSGEQWQADDVTFGAFRLNEGQIDAIGRAIIWTPPAGWCCRVSGVHVAGNIVYVPNAAMRGGAGGARNVASDPCIGDMRVTFKIVHPHEVSIVAVQEGETFGKFKAKNGKRLSILRDGRYDAAEMFEGERRQNTIWTWVWRVVSFFLLYWGLCAVLKPISVLGDVVPFIGSILEGGAGLIAGLVAAVVWLVTVAIAWLVYRPVIGLCVLAAVAIPVVWFVRRRKKAKGKETT